MTNKELVDLLNQIEKNNESNLELVRFEAFLIARCFSDVKKPSDLVTFSWEQKEPIVNNNSIDIEKSKQELIDAFNRANETEL